MHHQDPTAITSAYCSQHTTRTALRYRYLSGEGPGFVLEVRCRTLRNPDHSREVDELVTASGETRPDCRIGSRRHARVERIDVVLFRLHIERVLEFLQLPGILLRQIVRLAEILVDVVQLPFEVIGIWFVSDVYPRQAQRRCARHPTVFVDRPVSHHLEILGAVLCLRRAIVEGVHETLAVQRLLLHTIQHIRWSDFRGLVDGRRDIDYVAELRAQSTFVLDAGWPRDDHATDHIQSVWPRYVKRVVPTPMAGMRGVAAFRAP